MADFFSFIRQSRIATNLWQWGKVVCVWTLAAALIMGTLALRSLKRSADVSSRYYEKQLIPGLDEKIESIYSRVDGSLMKAESILSRLDRTAGEAELLTADLRKRQVPALFTESISTIRKVGLIADTANTELRQTGSLARGEVQRASETVNTAIRDLEPVVVESLKDVAANVVQVTNQFRAIGQRVQVIVEDQQLELDLRTAVSGLAGASSNLNIITGDVAHITTDAADYFHKLVTPPKGFRAKFKYVVQVLGQVGGLVLLGVRIAAGL